MAEQEIMLGEWAAEWFRVHGSGKLAPNTKGGYRNLIFNHIVPKLGGAALTDLSEKRIRAFYRKLSRAGLNDRSVWCVHLLLRRISWASCLPYEGGTAKSAEELYQQNAYNRIGCPEK